MTKRRKSWGLGAYEDTQNGVSYTHYGYCPKEIDPRKFDSDTSVNTEEEIRRWKQARRRAEKKGPTAVELAEALKNFKPAVPISYVVASRRAARNR